MLTVETIRKVRVAHGRHEKPLPMHSTSGSYRL